MYQLARLGLVLLGLYTIVNAFPGLASVGIRLAGFHISTDRALLDGST